MSSQHFQREFRKNKRTEEQEKSFTNFISHTNTYTQTRGEKGRKFRKPLKKEKCSSGIINVEDGS